MNSPTGTGPAVITALRIAVGVTALVSTILAAGFALQQERAPSYGHGRRREGVDNDE